ncbi:MAG: HD domain-containing phosphohydrolase [Mariprofundaceae bacterium]
MAKYIDLLREHQNKEGKAGNPPVETEIQNKNITHKNDNLEVMLAEESEPVSEADSSTIGDFPNSELLAEENGNKHDDEMPAPVPVNRETETKPQNTTDGELSTWLTHCSQEIAKLFKAASSNTPADIQPLTRQLSTFLEREAEDQNLIHTLELEISHREKKLGELDSDLGSLIQKSVKMMLYAIKIGQRLKLNIDEHRSHILAAMIHHIGMSQISSEIRNKKKKLTKDEVKEIRTASKKSHDYLSQCGITDAAILQAASQAQERYDGSGPQGFSGSNIAYSARVVGLLSMFEALIHYRPYRNRLLPRDAIRELVNHHKKAFDPKMLKALIESISLYPVGTYVQLNSGDVGLVTQIHLRLPLRPVVRITLDSQGNPIPPREVDLQVQPNLMVQRCMYEEGLLELKESADKEAY